MVYQPRAGSQGSPVDAIQKTPHAPEGAQHTPDPSQGGRTYRNLRRGPSGLISSRIVPVAAESVSPFSL